MYQFSHSILTCSSAFGTLGHTIVIIILVSCEIHLKTALIGSPFLLLCKYNCSLGFLYIGFTFNESHFQQVYTTVL